MKTKIIILFTCTLLLSVLITSNTMAQQPNNLAPVRNASNTGAAIYTYRVFEAPNKMFGYDVFQNGKGIFHQPAAIVSPTNPALDGKENSQTTVAFNQKHVNVVLSKTKDAEHAALLSIEKIKKQIPPTLTTEEIKKIVIQ
jgi:hypothetical protein